MVKDTKQEPGLSERVAVLETNDDNKETRLQKIEERIESWDKLILKTLLSFTTRLLFLLGIGGLMGGNAKAIKEKVIGWLSW